MKRRRSGPVVPLMVSAFAGYRFPPDVILLAVRWCLRFGLSYRDLEELLAERGVEVDHVSLYRWVQRFTPLVIDAARPCREGPDALKSVPRPARRQRNSVPLKSSTARWRASPCWVLTRRCRRVTRSSVAAATLALISGLSG
jgi:hypothetical protein